MTQPASENPDRPSIPTGHPVVDALAILANLLARLVRSAAHFASYAAYCLLIMLLVAGFFCPLFGYKLDVNLWGLHFYLGRSQ